MTEEVKVKGGAPKTGENTKSPCCHNVALPTRRRMATKVGASQGEPLCHVTSGCRTDKPEPSEVDSTTISSMAFVSAASTPTIQQQQYRPGVGAIEDMDLVDPKSMEAQKLISFVVVHFPSLEPVRHALIPDIISRITNGIAHIAFPLPFARRLSRGTLSFIPIT